MNARGHLYQKALLFLASAALFILPLQAAAAQPPAPAAEKPSAFIELILDASGSMWAKLGNSTRIDVAKNALYTIIDDLSSRKSLAAGLRVYGHRTNDCSDTKLEIPIGPLDGREMKDFISGIKPKGKTPIAYSLEEAAKDFDPSSGGSKTIILVTDGLESCGGDPCAAAQALAAKGIVSKIHVVGFGMDKQSVSQLECIVKPSGGLLLEANSASELARAFDRIVKTTLDTNLEIRGVDGKDRSVPMKVEVMKDGDVVLKGDGDTVKGSLPEGSYTIRAVASETGEEIFLEGTEVVPDRLSSLKAVFSIARLRVRGTDGKGKPMTISCQVFPQGKIESPEASFQSSDWYSLALKPGKYTVQAVNDKTKAAQSHDLVLEDGALSSLEILFDESRLLLKATSSGKPLNVDSWVYTAPYDKDNPGRASRHDGTGEVVHVVVPGTYDVLVKDLKTGTEQWARNVEIPAGQTVTREFSFGQGVLKFSAKGFEGKPIFFYVEVFQSPAEDNEEVLSSDSGDGEFSLTVKPGRYDIKVWVDQTSTVTWEKGVEIGAGTKFTKGFVFPAARVRIIPPGEGKKRSQIFVEAYVHPAEENEQPFLRDDGDGEYIQMFFAPGTYDFRITDEHEHEMWVRGIELAENERFSKEVTFEE